MAARKNSALIVDSKPAPTLVLFNVTGLGPTGQLVTLKQEGTDAYDAIWMARKRCSLNEMRAVPA